MGGFLLSIIWYKKLHKNAYHVLVNLSIGKKSEKCYIIGTGTEQQKPNLVCCKTGQVGTLQKANTTKYW